MNERTKLKHPHETHQWILKEDQVRSLFGIRSRTYYRYYWVTNEEAEAIKNEQRRKSKSGV